MDYIDAKKFLEQPKEVQEVLKDWIKDKYTPGDLVATHHGEIETAVIFKKFEGIESIDNEKESNGYFVIQESNNNPMILPEYEDWLIPQFNETQLRKFIQEKTASKIEIEYFWRTNSIIVSLVQPFDDFISKGVDYQIDGYDLLQAYWKVACEIAKEVK